MVFVFIIMGAGSLAMAIPQPVFPLYLTSIGIGPTTLGLIQSVAMVGMVIGEPSMGWLADRIGLKVPLSIGTFFCGLAVISFILTQNTNVIFIISLLWGVTRSAIFGPGRGYIGINAPPMKRATFMAFVSVTMAASRTAGALPGGFIADTLGFEWVFIVSSLISLIGGIFVITGIRKHKSVPAEKAQTVPASPGSPSQPTKVTILRFLFAQGTVAILFFFGFGALTTFLPLLATEVVGLSATRVGIIFTINGLVTMGLSIPMAMLADRKGKKVMLISGLVLSSLAMTGLAFADSFLWLIGSIVLFAVGLAMFEPASLGLISSMVPVQRLSTVMGIYGGIFENSGFIAGSALAGVIWSSLGPTATFLTGAITSAVGTLLCLCFVKEARQLPVNSSQ